MPTEASRRALDGLREPSTLQWYVIPLLAIVLYIYAVEVDRARRTRDGSAVVAGLTVFGMDFVNETVNGWILVLSDRSALWTAPGPTALRTMVGWNVEIMFMFALAGVIFARTLRDGAGWRERWGWAAGYSAFCVAVELLLNRGGLLVWEYAWWNASIVGTPLIFALGYFHFFAAAILVMGARTARTQVIAIATIYAVAITLNIVGLGVLGWRY